MGATSQGLCARWEINGWRSQAKILTMEMAFGVSRPSNGLHSEDQGAREPVRSKDGASPGTEATRPKPFVDFSHSTSAGAAKGMSLAFEFAGAVFLFWLIGRFADSRLGTDPWGQIVGSLTGWVGGFLHVYYATQRGPS